MFYYISFLRPPPLQASASPTDPILITHQIANDLRTEYLDDPIDIYYAWSLHAPRPTSPVLTKPAKLTSWRTSTAYKEIPVPRPPHLDGPSESSQWRLVLTCPGPCSPGVTPVDQAVVLGEPDTTGQTPFAVMSMPVTFPRRRSSSTSSRGHKNTVSVKGAKQERIARSYALRVPARDQPIVFDITEHTSFDLDKKIWDSGIGLSSWLVRLFSKDTDMLCSDLRDSLFSTDTRHILEIGAGTGIVAITLAVLRATLDCGDHPGSIVTTDLSSAIPILQDNIAANHHLMDKCVPQAAVLDWEDEQLPPEVQFQLEAGLDVIVMADVTYNTASFPALVGTLARLIAHCKRTRNGQPPRVLMGYKERHPDERSLWDRANEIGLHFQQIGQVNGAGGRPVEIWLG